MKTLLVFETGYGQEAICEIDDFPELMTGDTFDLPIFSVGGSEAMELGHAKIIRRHYRSLRQDRIIYCKVDQEVMNLLKDQQAYVEGGKIGLRKQIWGQKP